MSSAQRRGRSPRPRSRDRQPAAALAQPQPPSLRVLAVPLAFTAALAMIALTPRVAEHAILARSFWAAVAALLLWQAVLLLRLRSGGEGRVLELVTPRSQHYVQAMVQLSIFAYWGYHWRPVYEHAWLLVAQLAFAYAFDMLLAWTRRERYTLGFGPFPIIFSINLFLWFRDDWFYLQFLMIAIGFMGKEFVRWQREGKSTHIFNPSAFALGLFSLILISTRTTHLTWGPEIASTLSLAPHIYAYLFAGGLVVMYFFSITLVAASAAAVLFGLSALYSATTGVPYFLDTEIPAAVFLGLHLLVTDPSTSPRTPPGRLVFGVMYGLSVFGLYALLGAFGAPTFYDKLLAVPLLNLMVQRIDRMVRTIQPGAVIRALRLDGAPRANLAHMTLWIVLFGAMTAMGRTDGRHAGDSLPFWEQACAEGRPNACERLVLLETTYCADGSGWACNQVGRHYREARIVAADPVLAEGFFSRACEMRFQAACVNLLDPAAMVSAAPRVFDLRLLLREGGKNLMDMPEPDLYARACEHRWAFACERAAGAL